MPFTKGHPVCINRIRIGVRVLRLDKTELDPDYREAKQNRVYDPPVIVTGQVVALEQTFKLERTATGDSLPSTVHFVFRFWELDQVFPGFLIKKGDRIVSISDIPTDFNVIKSVKASAFGGNRRKRFAASILLHVDAEQNRKQLGSL